MHNKLNFKQGLENYFQELEVLSSKIASSISIGNFKEVTKLDLARKVILHKISKDTANLNDKNKERIKLVWVNNRKLIEKAENCIVKKQQEFNKIRKTFKAYSKNS